MLCSALFSSPHPFFVCFFPLALSVVSPFLYLSLTLISHTRTGTVLWHCSIQIRYTQTKDVESLNAVPDDELHSELLERLREEEVMHLQYQQKLEALRQKKEAAQLNREQGLNKCSAPQGATHVETDEEDSEDENEFDWRKRGL